MPSSNASKGYLNDARVYLSGPMDFVASRADEKRYGWRVRVGEFLRSLGTTVFDPWSKPRVRGLHEYGQEDVGTIRDREKWTFDPSATGAKARSECAVKFWETMHIDLRMVDVSDFVVACFVVACCPTNIYSVGTVHEIVMARQQHKPVLLVSPRVKFPVLDELRTRLAKNGDQEALALVDELEQHLPVKPNPRGIPSLWYMALVGGENFFDGFGFEKYRRRFKWRIGPTDERERECPPKRPLLPALERLNRKLPKKWSISKGRFVRDDNWLLLDIER